MKQFRLLLVLAALVGVSACNTAAPTSKGSDATNNEASKTTSPALSANAAVVGKNAATVAGPDGKPVTFMLNQLVVATNDTAVLQGFLNRWQGRVLKTIDPVKAKLDKVERLHLIEVNVSAMNASNFEKDIKQLEPGTQGPFKFSSTAGLQLLAVAARETIAGLKVNPNWIMKPASFETGQTREAPTGPAGYSSNAFQWSYLKSGGVQNIGVTQAWQALERSGRLANRVSVAIVDTGFVSNYDLPDGWQARSTDSSPALGTTGPIECLPMCRWHGTAVAGTLAGVPNNNWGTAGPGGPVAKPTLIYFDGSYINLLDGLFQSTDSRIINISYGIRLPLGLGWTMTHLDITTAALALSNHLIFAAAGNDYEDVDAESCFVFCTESAYIAPCEGPGVICVGGLDNNSKNLAQLSNYGKEDVDIAAPFFVYGGPDSDYPQNQTRLKTGTSVASPFAAGVAALIWAANPNLSANQVEQRLLATAHYSQDDRVRKYVNAFGAVYATIGSTPPGLVVTDPAPGQNVSISGARLAASASDFEDANCCTVTWTSSVDGTLGVTNGGFSELFYRFTTTGPRTIRVVARDSSGASSVVQSIPINVVSTAPNVFIIRPLTTTDIFQGVPTRLLSEVYDADNQSFACQWRSVNLTDPVPAAGCNSTIIFSSAGPRTLVLTATDSLGLSTTKSVAVLVKPKPPVLVQITNPLDGAFVAPFAPIQLAATVTGGIAPYTHTWSVAYPVTSTGGTIGVPGTVGSTFVSNLGVGSSVSWMPDTTLRIGQSPCQEFDVYAQLFHVVRDVNGVEGSGRSLIRLTSGC